MTREEYMTKLENFVAGRTMNVLRLNNQFQLRGSFDAAAVNYNKPQANQKQASGRKKENRQ